MPATTENDLMYPYTKGQGLSAVALDVGRNDYYGHGQSWWDLRNSAWLEHLDRRRSPLLTVSFGEEHRQRHGARATFPGSPARRAARPRVRPGSMVTLTATPADGSRFAGWEAAPASPTRVS